MAPIRPDRVLSHLACLLTCALLLLPGRAIATQACLLPAGGIGGTGVPQGGIGGTGAPAVGGTGGTGDRADAGIGGTGIVGTITGFASVCIGELEVHFDATTPVSMNAEISSLGRLALGQVVAIEAAPGSKGLTARSIAILNALEGPVTRADSARSVLEVMGQPVRLAAGVDASRLVAGTAVRVSGFRDAQGIIHATRVEPAPDLRIASAIGFLHSDKGAFNLDGLAVAGAGGTAGSELLVRGYWDGRRLQVRERRSDPSLPFVGRVRNVVIEGLVHSRNGQQLRISGFDVRLNPASRSDSVSEDRIVEGSKVRVVGRIEQGRRIGADRVVIERGRDGTEDRTIGPKRDNNSEVSSEEGRARNMGGESGESTEGKRSGDSSGGSGPSSRGNSDGGSSDRSGGSGASSRGSSDRSSGSSDRNGGSGDRGGGSGNRGSQVEKTEKISGKTDKPVKPESGRGGRN